MLMGIRNRVRIAGFAVLLGVLMAACAGRSSDTRAAPPSTSTTAAPSTSPVSISVPLEVAEDGSYALLDARLAAQGRRDRFVLEFADAVPPRWVAFGSQPAAGECEVPKLEGSAFLNVTAYPS